MKTLSVFLLSLSGLPVVALLPDARAQQTSAKVAVEHDFDVDADMAWKKLGRFCSIAQWQSLVASCAIEERADGMYRIVVMKNDSAFTERLEEYSFGNRSFAYTIKSGPLPIRDYRSEFRLVPSGETQTRLVWKAWYTVPEGGDEQKIASDLRSLFGNGIKGMTAFLARTPP